MTSGLVGLVCQGPTDVDEVVTHDAETYITLHAAVSLVATAIQAVASLEHADPAFAAGPPLLPLLEPALLLQLSAFCTLGRTVAYGNRLTPSSCAAFSSPAE